jgi:hypothetical protein
MEASSHGFIQRSFMVQIRHALSPLRAQLFVHQLTKVIYMCIYRTCSSRHHIIAHPTILDCGRTTTTTTTTPNEMDWQMKRLGKYGPGKSNLRRSCRRRDVGAPRGCKFFLGSCHAGNRAVIGNSQEGTIIFFYWHRCDAGRRCELSRPLYLSGTPDGTVSNTPS